MDRPFEEMASSGRAVREAEHDVNVEARLVVVADCNVPNGAQHLTLLIHFDFLVGLAGEIKPAHRRSFDLKAPIAVSEAAEIPVSRAKA